MNSNILHKVPKSTINYQFGGVVDGCGVVLGPTTILSRMPGLYTIDAQHAVPLATFYYIYSGVRANSVIIEKPLNVNG